MAKANRKTKILNLNRMRVEYRVTVFDERTIAKSPVVQFRRWYRDAARVSKNEPNAMALATVGRSGRPSQRIVLLKELSHEGFVFFTNFKSRKAEELVRSKSAALLFYYPENTRQIRIEGRVRKISTKASATYFATRPRGAQIAAWASPQSRKLSSRAELEHRYNLTLERFRGQKIPRPPDWGGYVLIPSRVEFWQGGQNRLHDRLVYERRSGRWHLSRLAP